MQLIRTRKFILGLVAASLLAGSALTARSVIAETTIAKQSLSQNAIDPTRGFSGLVERVMPSVVSVEVKFTPASAEKSAGDSIPPQMQEFLEKFPQFRNEFPQRQQPRAAMGSGFVISTDGYVVTNNHVVEKASEVRVTFEDGTEHDATVIGTDPKTDLALLKIKSNKTFVAVPFADDEAKVGDWVMAVGNPFGLGGTVTTGIVSARGRNIGSGPYDDYLQIDASINRGNSGGPAFNLEGEVIGVNTAIFSPSGGSVGIGFAIPAKQVASIVESLKADGTVTRGWLGVSIQSVNAELAEGLGLKEAKGVLVSNMTENSPAREAGIKPGDTILTFAGKSVKDARELTRLVATVKPGNNADVELIRNGKPLTISVNIGLMPGETPKMASLVETTPNSLSGLGIEVAPAEDGVGLKVLSVKPNSEAADKGLSAGDIILEVAGSVVNNTEDAVKALAAEDGNRVLVLLKEGNDQRFVALPKKSG